MGTWTSALGVWLWAELVLQGLPVRSEVVREEDVRGVVCGRAEVRCW